MATFVINAGQSGPLGERTVEAESYEVDEHYIHFRNVKREQVLSIRRDQVNLIERQ